MPLYPKTDTLRDLFFYLNSSYHNAYSARTWSGRMEWEDTMRVRANPSDNVISMTMRNTPTFQVDHEQSSLLNINKYCIQIPETLKTWLKVVCLLKIKTLSCMGAAFVQLPAKSALMLSLLSHHSTILYITCDCPSSNSCIGHFSMILLSMSQEGPGQIELNQCRRFYSVY